MCSGIDWLRVPQPGAEVTHAAYTAYVFVHKDPLPAVWNRDTVLEEFVERDITAFSGSCSEVYLEKVFGNSGLRPLSPLPIARELGEASLMFLCLSMLSDGEMVQICNAILAVNSGIEREMVA